MNSAVAFFIYKRHSCTKLVWDAIRRARPPVLLVIADGPREEKDRVECEKTRSIVASPDWPCDVRRNYSAVNMGCRDRMASGLEWVFEEVEEAIILEDDCLPADGFFGFCDEMLARYRDDTRVMHVSGNNFLRGAACGPYSYYFSKYSFSWGWATWRRSWRSFDLQVRLWPAAKAANLLGSICSLPEERRFWGRVFDRQYKGASKAWDYSWLFSCWVNHGVSVVPVVNLVTNIGEGAGATHTQKGLWFMNLPTGKLGAIRPPPVMIINVEADRQNYDEVFKPPLWDRMRETVLNPWAYTAVLRNIPMIGPLWARFRAAAKGPVSPP